MKSRQWLWLCLLLASAASADTFRAPPQAPVQWKTECSACHITYPPQLLAAPDWRSLMQGLDKHFGSDASLGAADASTIAAFLQKYAPAGGGRFDAPSGRISDTAWFQRKHHEIPPQAFKSREIRSAANCQACHAKAEQGGFSEHELTPLGARFGD